MSTTPSKPSIAKRISSIFATNKPATPSTPQKEPTSSTTLNEGTPSDDSFVKIDHPIIPSPPNSPLKKKFFSTMLSKKKEAVPVIAKENDQVESSSRTFEASPPKKSLAKRVSTFFKFGQPAPINTAVAPPATTTAAAPIVIPEIIVQSPCDQGITIDYNNLGHGGEDDEEQKVSLLKKVSMELEGAEVGSVFIKSFDEVKKNAEPIIEEKKEAVGEKKAEPVIEKEEAVEKKVEPVIEEKKEALREEQVEPVIEKEVAVEKEVEPVVDAPAIEEKATGTTIGELSPSTPVEAPASNASKNKKKNNKKKNKNKK